MAPAEPRGEHPDHRRAREPRENEGAGGKRSRRAQEGQQAHPAGTGRAVELANHVENLELVEGAVAMAMEPNLYCTAAIWSPETGLVDSEVMRLIAT